ncbi:MAG: tyrosine-type recombinase/integrase, partial [Capsulimonadales bacterium]|nr:tyrosine-type recombinase/integrase [Capsulimonadales bacterium]
MDYGWVDAVNEFRKHNEATKAPKTVRFYDCQLRQVIDWAENQRIPFSEFSKRDMDKYIAHRRAKVDRRGNGLSRTTLRHDGIAIKAFFKFCRRRGIVERDRFVDYEVHKAPKPPRYMPSDEDIFRLIVGIRDYWNPDKNKDIKNFDPKSRAFHRDRNIAILLGLLDTAARIGEMVALKIDDYRSREKLIVIRQAKGKVPRTVPISDHWIAAMEDWLRIRQKLFSGLTPEERKALDEGWLFVTETGGKVDPASFSKTI